MADDAGGSDLGPEAGVDASESAASSAGCAGAENDGASSCGDASSSTPSTPLACDGALCDTTNGATCSIAGRVGAPAREAAWLVPSLAGLALGLARAKRGTNCPDGERAGS